MPMSKEKWIAQRPIRIKKLRIEELKTLLDESDYKAIKYAEGLISEEDYTTIKEERDSYRKEINQLEEEIAEISQKIGVLIE